MKKLLLILVLAVMCSSVARADDFEDAYKEWNSGNSDLFIPLAEQGDARAQHYLGLSLMDGIGGVTEDKKEGVRWHRKAAEQGHVGSQVELGYAYIYGWGVIKDHKKSVKWFRKAAEQGDTTGQNNLGYAYRSGRGVIKDHKKSVSWFQKSAEQGDFYGQLGLGKAYKRGGGVIQDYKRSLKWFRKAAENETVDVVVRKTAYLELAHMYSDEKSVIYNASEAVKSARLAVPYGSSKIILGTSYHHGEGVMQDYARAHMYYNLQGGELGGLLRDDIAKIMTPGQIAEAQRMARECEKAYKVKYIWTCE